MSERERHVLRLLNGIPLDPKPMQFDQMSKIFGISKQRVDQIMRSGIRKIQKNCLSML